MNKQLLLGILLLMIVLSHLIPKLLTQSTILGTPQILSSDMLVQDTYPTTGVNQVTKKQPSGVWWKYPIFKVGSYDQITNNLRYSKNPDIGRCTPSEFCDSMYEDIKNKSNYVNPLPPVVDSSGTRVGYFIA